jgi:hypothetical protein
LWTTGEGMGTVGAPHVAQAGSDNRCPRSVPMSDRAITLRERAIHPPFHSAYHRRSSQRSKNNFRGCSR